MRKRFFIFFLILILILGVTLIWYQHSLSPVNNQDNTPIAFSISKGQSAKEIANQLQQKGLIRSPVAFFVYIRLTGLTTKIQAGNYHLKKTASTPEIAYELTHGTTDKWITLLEGWRAEEIADVIAQNFNIPQSEFLKLAKEGYLFPDSYLIPQETNAQEIINIILDNFQKKVTPEIIAKGQNQGLTLDQIITLASIIEREARQDQDRPIVADILIKRLKNNWPLQADATIQYALGYQPQEKTWWRKNLTKEDLEIDSPYNTYKYLGLPPTPISNPGLASIQAVVNPQPTDYWFYLSDKNGFLHFAKTHAQHEENIEKYLR